MVDEITFKVIGSGSTEVPTTDQELDYKVVGPAHKEPVYPPESLWGGVKRNIARAATNVPALLDVPTNIASLMQAPIGRPEGMTPEQIEELDIPEPLKDRLRDAYKSYNVPSLVKQLQEKVLPEEWHEPRGKWEKVLDNAVGSVATYGLLGGPGATLASSVGAGIGGDIVEKTLDEYGLHPVVSKGANLLTQWVLGGLSKTNPKNIIKRTRKNINKAYNKAYALEGETTAPIEATNNINAKIKDQLEFHAFPDEVNKKITSKLQYVADKINEPKIINGRLVESQPTIGDLMKLKRGLNQAAFRKGVHSDVKNALLRTSGTIKDELMDFANTKPAFYDAYFGTAEKLTEAINVFDKAIKNISKDTNIQNVLNKTLSQGALKTIAKAPLKIPQFLLGNWVRSVTPTGKLLFKSPENMSKLLLNNVIDSAIAGKGALAKLME